jgi:hypothetical protein
MTGIVYPGEERLDRGVVEGGKLDRRTLTGADGVATVESILGAKPINGSVPPGSQDIDLKGVTEAADIKGALLSPGQLEGSDMLRESSRRDINPMRSQVDSSACSSALRVLVVDDDKYDSPLMSRRR